MCVCSRIYSFIPFSPFIIYFAKHGFPQKHTHSALFFRHHQERSLPENAVRARSPTTVERNNSGRAKKIASHQSGIKFCLRSFNPLPPPQPQASFIDARSDHSAATLLCTLFFIILPSVSHEAHSHLYSTSPALLAQTSPQLQVQGREGGGVSTLNLNFGEASQSPTIHLDTRFDYRRRQTTQVVDLAQLMCLVARAFPKKAKNIKKAGMQRRTTLGLPTGVSLPGEVDRRSEEERLRGG